MITISHIKKKYQDGQAIIHVLKDVSLTIENGQWVSLLGPSGSGKTTLLKMIGGMLKPDSGTIHIEDQEIYRLKEKERQSFRRETIGYVFQDFRLLPQYSVLENVMLPQIPYRSATELKKKALIYLEKLGMADRIRHLPNQLSGGEKQRTAIARAMINEPSILLCDEPTGNLDRHSRDAVMTQLKALNDEGHAVLLVTHDVELTRYGDRTVEMQEGVLKEEAYS